MIDEKRSTWDCLYTGADLSLFFKKEINEGGYPSVWEWIAARIRAASFAGVHVGDYIPLTLSDGKTFKMEVAGIDTYYRYGSADVGHHIDFISRDCHPDLRVWNRVNYNNGTSAMGYPWLASDLNAWLNSLQTSVPNAETADPALIAVDYSTTGVLDKFPAALKALIVPKNILSPIRYAAGALLTDDNSWSWTDFGKLWLPSEIEVSGCEYRGSKNGYSSGGFVQYPIFAQNMRRIKGADDGGGRSSWWLSSALGGSSDNCALVGAAGDCTSYWASFTGIRVPLCFRIA
jgi:hypothetical protein